MTSDIGPGPLDFFKNSKNDENSRESMQIDKMGQDRWDFICFCFQIEKANCVLFLACLSFVGAIFGLPDP